MLAYLDLLGNQAPLANLEKLDPRVSRDPEDDGARRVTEE